jgi:putative flippase GtrA
MGRSLWLLLKDNALWLWNFVTSFRLMRFLIAGCFSTGVGLSVSFVLTSILGVWYMISVTIAFVASYAISFTFQRFWTFQNSTKEGRGAQLALHLPLQLGNLVLELIAMRWLVEYEQLWYFYAQILVTALISVESFFATRYIFSHKAPDV